MGKDVEQLHIVVEVIDGVPVPQGAPLPAEEAKLIAHNKNCLERPLPEPMRCYYTTKPAEDFQPVEGVAS